MTPINYATDDESSDNDIVGERRRRCDEESVLEDWDDERSVGSIDGGIAIEQQQQQQQIGECNLPLPEIEFTNPSRTMFFTKAGNDISKTPTTFNDCEQYFKHFLPLLKLEREARIHRNVPIKWQEPFRSLRLPEDIKLRIGWTFTLEIEGVIWKAEVIDEAGNIIQLDLDPERDPMDSALISAIDLGSVTEERAKKALESFSESKTRLPTEIIQSILGNRKPLDDSIPYSVRQGLNAPGLPKLDPYQSDLVRNSLQSRVTLIQGPPGTGKTVTAATLVWHVVQNTGYKVLVCAPSNAATTNLCNRIRSTGLFVVHVTARSLERENTAPGTLQAMVQQQLGEGYDPKSERRIENKILDMANVVCCTCVVAGDSRLNTRHFETVLVDEASLITEPVCMIAIQRASERIVLLGDHYQLGPLIKSEEAREKGLGKSIFERLIDSGLPCGQLATQYRMHPEIAIFASETFYNGTLKNGILERACSIPQMVEDFLPSPGYPMLFLNHQGKEVRLGHSYKNPDEFQQILKIIGRLVSAGVSTEDIGVMSPYNAQLKHIKENLQPQYDSIELRSVDSFQGLEKNYIIFGTVCSDISRGIGFLDEPSRINVALTRAKRCLFILGNRAVLAENGIWGKIIDYYESRGCLVEEIRDRSASSTLSNEWTTVQRRRRG